MRPPELSWFGVAPLAPSVAISALAAAAPSPGAGHASQLQTRPSPGRQLGRLTGPAAAPRNVLFSPCEARRLPLGVANANSPVWALRRGAPGALRPCFSGQAGRVAGRKRVTGPRRPWEGLLTGRQLRRRERLEESPAQRWANGQGGAFRPALTGLPSRRRFLGSGRRDSNPRPQPWQGCALPAEPRPRCPHRLALRGAGALGACRRWRGVYRAGR